VLTNVIKMLLSARGMSQLVSVGPWVQTPVPQKKQKKGCLKCCLVDTETEKNEGRYLNSEFK
jgi:hypothetical protein